MPNKLNLLFVINGYGMGNATRCESVIQILKHTYNIEIITSDRSFDFFKTGEFKEKLYRQTNLNKAGGNTYGSFIFYLFFLFPFLNRMFLNWKIQNKIIQLRNPELVIFDSDYSFVIHRIFKLFKKNKSLLVGLNNSLDVLTYFKENPKDLKLSLIPSLLVETLDFAVHRLFCDHIIFPSFNNQNNIKTNFITQIPPLIRKSIFEELPGNRPSTSADFSIAGYRTLAYASSSDVDSPLKSFLNKINLKNAFNPRNEQDIKSSELVISNAGQSTLSESIYLSKKLIIIPIPRHAEQYVNSKRLNSMGAVSIINFIPTDLKEVSEIALKAKNLKSPWTYSELDRSVCQAFSKISQGCEI